MKLVKSLTKPSADVEIRNLNERISGLERELESHRNEISRLLSSTCWKVTKPIRLIKNLYLRLCGIEQVVVTNAEHRHIPDTSPVQAPPEIPYPYIIQNVSISDAAKIIEFSPLQTPTVSIIIPACGQLTYTMNCLLSIYLNPQMTTFEILVVDDCSPDETNAVLSRIPGIDLITNSKNIGFLKSCNKAAKKAKGEYLLFLNNDTQVTPHWMDELMLTFTLHSNVGLVGSKLVFPDGRLQEAGAIIFDDASGYNFGRGENPLHPAFNFSRETDYCSGAAIMVRKETFSEGGSFDERYSPAYYEDTDLAMRIRKSGQRVMYQPHSTVIHFEGVTSGTDLSSGVKAYQVINGKTFYERWKKELVHHHPQGDVYGAKDRMIRKRLLFLDLVTPTPDIDSGSIDTVNTMILLRDLGFHITFIPTDSLLPSGVHTQMLQRLGIEVLYAPYITTLPSHLQEKGDQYDLVVITRYETGVHHMKHVKEYCPQAKIIFNPVDLHHIRFQRNADITGNQAVAEKVSSTRRAELDLIHFSHATTIISEHELSVLKEEQVTGNLYHLPYARQVAGTQVPFEERSGIVFAGSYEHPPNLDAIYSFIEEILPRIHEKDPTMKVYLVGKNPPGKLLELASDTIIVTGYIRDLESFLHHRRISIAPLRFGGGIKGKVGGAMACGLPVIATPVAAEGMNLTHKENVLIGATADEFANHVQDLYFDKTLWNRLSTNSIRFAEENWGSEVIYTRLRALLKDLGFDTHSYTTAHPCVLYNDSFVRDDVSLSPLGTLFTRCHHADAPSDFPGVKIRTYGEFTDYCTDNARELQIRTVFESSLCPAVREPYLIDGHCALCGKDVEFVVDFLYAPPLQNKNVPNWRERVTCPLCSLNNRMRATIHYIQTLQLFDKRNRLFLSEQTTPLYHFLTAQYDNIVGSEYLGEGHSPGQIVDGIRHENLTKLSFDDTSLDGAICLDVFEHIPDYRAAFSEILRSLKPGGRLIFTVPFREKSEKNEFRAKITNGEVEHILAPEYHGDPLSSSGCLCYQYFGWEVLDELRDAGYDDVHGIYYWSPEYGYLGEGQLIFSARKHS